MIRKDLSIQLLVLIIILGSLTGYSAATDETLLAHYAMNDSSSPEQPEAGTQATDLSWYGTPDPTNDCKEGSCLRFQYSGNSGDRKESIQDTSNYFGQPSHITVMMWLKPEDTSGQHIIWGAGVVTSDDKGIFGMIDNGNVKMLAGDGSGSEDYVKTPAKNAEWNHYAMTYDGSTLRLYENGNEVDNLTSNSGSINFYTSRDGIGIGRYQSWNPSYDGYIDEFKVYDGALTKSEIEEAGNLNDKPSINILDTAPRNWTLDSSVDLNANVSDTDGNISWVAADVYENGTKILSNSSLSDPEGDGNWTNSSFFTSDEKDVWYNISVTTRDDSGGTTTENLTKYMETVDLAWNHPENPEGYKIYTNATDSQSAVATTSSTALTYVSTALQEGVYTQFNVTAYNQYGESQPKTGYIWS